MWSFRGQRQSPLVHPLLLSYKSHLLSRLFAPHLPAPRLPTFVREFCFWQAKPNPPTSPIRADRRAIMDKSRSFSEYYAATSYVGFGYDDRASSYSFNGPSGKEAGFHTSADPEAKRKKRIAAYNSFVSENKLKSSMRSGLRWIKSKFTDDRYG